MLQKVDTLVGTMESSRQALNPMSKPRKHERHETDRRVSADDADYSDVRDSGTESAKSVVSASVPLHSVSCLRGYRFRSRGQHGWSSRVFLTGPPEAAGNDKKKVPDSRDEPRKHEGNDKPQMDTDSELGIGPSISVYPWLTLSGLRGNRCRNQGPQTNRRRRR